MPDVFSARSFPLAGHSVLTFPPDLCQPRVSKSKQFSEAKAQAARTASLLFPFQQRGSSLGRAMQTHFRSLDLLFYFQSSLEGSGWGEVSAYHACDLFQKQTAWKGSLKTPVSKG